MRTVRTATKSASLLPAAGAGRPLKAAPPPGVPAGPAPEGARTTTKTTPPPAATAAAPEPGAASTKTAPPPPAAAPSAGAHAGEDRPAAGSLPSPPRQGARTTTRTTLPPAATRPSAPARLPSKTRTTAGRGRRRAYGYRRAPTACHSARCRAWPPRRPGTRRGRSQRWPPRPERRARRAPATAHADPALTRSQPECSRPPADGVPSGPRAVGDVGAAPAQADRDHDLAAHPGRRRGRPRSSLQARPPSAFGQHARQTGAFEIGKPLPEGEPEAPESEAGERQVRRPPRRRRCSRRPADQACPLDVAPRHAAGPGPGRSGDTRSLPASPCSPGGARRLRRSAWSPAPPDRFAGSPSR